MSSQILNNYNRIAVARVCSWAPTTLLTLSLLSVISNPLAAMTLDQAFKEALKFQSEIRNGRLNIEQAEVQKKLVRKYYYPELSVSSHFGAYGSDEEDSTDYHRTTLSLSQPLYRGGLLGPSQRLAANVTETRKLELLTNKTVLYGKVADAFLQVIALRKDLNHLNQQGKTLRQRIKVISSRVKIGRNRKADLIAAQAQEAGVQAEYTRVSGLLESARIDLASLMGKKHLKDKLVEPKLSFTVPKSWTRKVLESPLIEVQKQRLEGAKIKKEFLEGEYYPSVDASINFYPIKSESASDNDWDVLLEANWTLFDGGIRSAEVASQAIEEKKLINNLETIKIESENQYRAVQLRVERMAGEIKNLEKAVRLSKSNYDLYQKEYDSGLVSILDVLRSFDNYLDLQRTLSNRIVRKAALFYQLKAQVGDLP